MNSLSIHRVATALSVFALLGACSGMNPAGLLAASRLDPVNTPVDEITVAIGVPETLRLEDGDAELRLAFDGGAEAPSVMLDETAPLKITPSWALGPTPTAAGETVYVANIAPEDATRIAAVQNEIRQLRGRGIDGSGSLSVTVNGGCFTGSRPASIPVSTWLQTNPEEGFVALTRQQDVLRAVGTRNAALLQSRLTPCDE